MYTYLNLLLQVCLFKKAPQDIPYSQLLLRLSIIAFAAISYLLSQLSNSDFNALLQVSVELIISLGFVAIVLTISNKRKRFVQTATTLVGTDALFSFFAMPILATLSINNENLLAALSMLGLMLWSWLVTIHIIRHAISTSFSFAAGIVFLYIFSTYQIIAVLFPSTPAS